MRQPNRVTNICYTAHVYINIMNKMLFFYLAVKNPGKHCLSQVMKVNLTPVISHVSPTCTNVMS